MACQSDLLEWIWLYEECRLVQWGCVGWNYPRHLFERCMEPCSWNVGSVWSALHIQQWIFKKVFCSLLNISKAFIVNSTSSLSYGLALIIKCRSCSNKILLICKGTFIKYVRTATFLTPSSCSVRDFVWIWVRT